MSRKDVAKIVKSYQELNVPGCKVIVLEISQFFLLYSN